MRPDFEGPRSPFELGLVGLCVVAVVFVIALIGLYLTDSGIINW